MMYDNIISVENLLLAWKEFIRGKRSKLDVQEFQHRLADNVIALHHDLKNKTYVHGGYHSFNISDPKPRNIHKASVRDRLLHRAVYRILYPYFDRKFIIDSYSCRNGKGTHKAMNRFRTFSYKASKNHTRTAWALKCDIKKFFASIDQASLLSVLAKHIKNNDILDLLYKIITSFSSTKKLVGLPLGNLTSQLLVNIYVNEFDQFTKHELKAKYYIRYADDFVIMSTNRTWLVEILPKIRNFLRDRLALELHPNKISIETIASGIDFLGWVHFPDHRILRTSTKRRMLKNINKKNSKATKARSYLGLLCHGNTNKLREEIEAAF